MSANKNAQYPQNITGTQFGRLTVLSQGGLNSSRARLWICRCVCGQQKSVTRSHLVRGDTKSCGCLRRETLSANRISGKTGRGIRHSLESHGEYRIWIGMRYRCKNPNCKDYYKYGGRGINICERWDKSFQEFYSDMGPRPTKEHSIDRINNDGGYDASNCRWATVKEQANNRNPRNSHKLTKQEALEIFGRLAAGETHSSIACDYPVGRSLIGMMATGKSWSHLQLEEK